jgi:hypothetical protein
VRDIEIDRCGNEVTVLRRVNESIPEVTYRDMSNIVSCTSGRGSSPLVFRHKMVLLFQSLVIAEWKDNWQWKSEMLIETQSSLRRCVRYKFHIDYHEIELRLPR